MELTADSSLVSAVLQAFTRAETLGRAIESVLRQDHAQLALIVVDDGLRDETGGEFLKLAQPFVYVQEAQGVLADREGWMAVQVAPYRA